MKRITSFLFVLMLVASVFACTLIPSVSAADTPTDEEVNPDEASVGMYYEIYDIICEAFYGTTEPSGVQELVATVLATAAICLVFVIPFMVVVFAIKLFMGR